jgi:hypothetical protein
MTTQGDVPFATVQKGPSICARARTYRRTVVRRILSESRSARTENARGKRLPAPIVIALQMALMLEKVDYRLK